MSPTADQFAKAAVAAGLLTADEIKALWGAIPAGQRPKDGETFSKLLIEKEKLTAFQAEELLAGGDTPLVLGEHVLIGRIGAGGMGQVFKAHHRRMKRLVAIKFLPTALMKDADAVKRFEREVEVAAKLIHPNIVTAHDAGEIRGRHYLVMEYVEGRDLAGVVAKEGALPVARAVDYVRQAARGLALAHKNGVVHRDIKPANLLLDKEGTVKILDMGLARLDDAAVAKAQEGLTQSGQVMGTVDYMAPEQAFNTKNADARADIYSLGCTLWRLLTGKNLFDGETIVEKLMAHQATPIPSLAALRPDVPAALVAIFEKMVAKKPDERFAAMADVEVALAQLLSPTSPQPYASQSAGPEQKRQGFFSSLLGAKPVATAVKSQTAAPPADGFSPTVSLVNPLVSTDPVSERSIQIARGPLASATAERRPTKLSMWIASGVTLVVLVAFGIWVIVRDKDGNEVGRMKVPDGGTATVTSDPSSGTPPKTDARGKASAVAKLPGKLFMNDPAFPLWVKQVQTLSATEQVQAVLQKLRDVNLEYKTTYPPKHAQESETVTELKLRAVSGLNDLSPLRALSGLKSVGLDQCRPLADLSPLQGLPLVSLTLNLSAVTDLSPLKGMPLEFLSVPSSVDDLTPLQGMPLKTLLLSNPNDISPLQGLKLSRLEFDNAPIRDLSPLKGMPLTILKCTRSQITDLSPLKGMPLVSLNCNMNPIHNLSPLHDCPTLATLDVTKTKVTPATVTALQKALPNCKIEWDDPAKTTNQSAPSLAVAPFDATQAKAHQQAWATHLGLPVEYENQLGMKFVLIPPGEFIMGGTPAEIVEALKFANNKQWQDLLRSEAPLHKVILTEAFYLGVNEVTQKEYLTVMGANPSHFSLTGSGKAEVTGLDTQNHPVESVSWNDAAEFCAKLSLRERLQPHSTRNGNVTKSQAGKGYRLPTEAEWEFACRAGTTSRFWHGDDENALVQNAWFDRNSGPRTHPVGQLKPNPFGLFDMHGNVWNWVQDGWALNYYEQFAQQPAINPTGPMPAGAERIVRGGSRRDAAAGCRSSNRGLNLLSGGYPSIGFRVCLAADAVRELLKNDKASSTGPAPPLAQAPFDAHQARAYQEAWAKYLGTEVETKNKHQMRLTLIPPGEFQMGSTDADVKAALKIAEEEKADAGVIGRIQKAERPQHLVRITKPFLLGMTEVTIGEFKKFSATGYVTEAEKKGETKTYLAPGYAVQDDSPATMLTWNDAAAFCNWLSQQHDLEACYRPDVDTWIVLPGKNGYRLPTEAEWEFACRAGTTTQYSFGDNVADLVKYGWYKKNANQRSNTVATLAANPFGLFDMHGNASEWCQDFFDEKWYAQSGTNYPTGPSAGSSRVIRGGNWNHFASYCRSAYRHDNAPLQRNGSLGFRVVRVW